VNSTGWEIIAGSSSIFGPCASTHTDDRCEETFTSATSGVAVSDDPISATCPAWAARYGLIDV
jgi:hypothetical protein